MKINTLPVAVKMLTINPIRMMKLDVNKGLLLPGWDADICIFDDNVDVRTVLCGGEIVHTA